MVMKTVIVGATGYSGLELTRLLLAHPYFSLNGLVSTSHAGEQLAQHYPHLAHLAVSFAELDLDLLCAQGEVIFFATPPGVSREWAPQLLERGKIVIDLSADFRLHEAEAYEMWYQQPAAPQHWLTQAVYGLSEWFSEPLRTANLIANPGCYPTATLLALIPLLQADLLAPHSLIIDAKSGVSGAGRSADVAFGYSELHNNLRPYKITGHQHIAEIEQLATQFAQQDWWGGNQSLDAAYWQTAAIYRRTTRHRPGELGHCYLCFRRANQ
jgi:N-acetyl-gamma-glutamyl-phosphate reductase